ncbi:g6158 [Coccomyxa elongata]
MQEWSEDDSGAEFAAQQLPKRQKRSESIQEINEGGTRRVTRAQVRNWSQHSGNNVVKLAPKDADYREHQEESSSSSDADEQSKDGRAHPFTRAAPRRSGRSCKPALGKGAQKPRARRKAAVPLLPETSSEEEQSAPQRREARGNAPHRRWGSKLIHGGGDVSSDDYDDDIDGFIVSSGEEGADAAAESAREDSDEEEDGGRQVARNRARSEAPRCRDGNQEQQPKERRRLRKVGSMPQQVAHVLADTSSVDEKLLATSTAQRKGKQPAAPELPESGDDDQPGTCAQHARQALTRRSSMRNANPAAVLEDGSEEEEEKPERPLERLGKKRRTRQAAGADVAAHEAAPGTELVDEGDGKEEVDELAERSVEKKRLRKTDGAVVTAGGQGEAGRAAVQTRTRTLPTRPSVLERLQQHQAAHSLGKGSQRAEDGLEESQDRDDGLHDHQIPEDESDGDSPANDQPGLIILDEEEEEDVGGNGQAQDGSESDESMDSFIEKDDNADTGANRGAVSSPLEGLGLTFQRPDLRASFDLYLDYLLYSLADRDFEAKLDADQRQRREYLAAVKRIEEEELATWREHFAKSDAWKRALPGFIPAVERLPGLSMYQGRYDVSLNPGLEEDDPGEVRECAACERLHSRATMELTFKGRPYWPDYKYGTKSLARMAIRSDDYDSDLEGEDGERRERKYIVGQHCAVRVQLYHALWHYKHHIRGKLKKQLKKSREYLQRVRRPSSWMDAAASVTDHNRLYNALFYNFRGLKMAAERYSSSSVGGGYSRAGESIRKTTENVNKLIYRLNSDSEGDEGSDIAFSDQDDATGSAGVEEEAGSGSEDEGGPEEAEADMEGAEEHADSGHEPLDSRQLNSQPVRRRLVLSDDSDADSPADISANPCTAATAGRASVKDISTQLLDDGAAAGTATDPAASGASPGSGRGAADAPVVALAAQSAAGVQAALQRAKSGATPPGSRGRTTATAGSGGGGASSAPGSVMRQRGIKSYFSPKKAST